MSDLELIKEDVERYYKEQDEKGYNMVKDLRTSTLFNFETVLKFAAMYHATKRMEEDTRDKTALNIDLVSSCYAVFDEEDNIVQLYQTEEKASKGMEEFKRSHEHTEFYVDTMQIN